MRVNGKNSSPGDESMGVGAQKGKITLVSCPGGGNICSQHLVNINKNFHESEKYRLEKNYSRAFDLLKEAYQTTHDLQKESCLRCATMFRSTIARTVENMQTELHKMSTGLFKNKRYKEVYVEAGKILQEMKNGG